MKKNLLSLSVVVIVLLALASGAYASAVLDPDNGGSYHFTWGTGGLIDHVYAMESGSIVLGGWDDSWSINNTNLGGDWSITVTQNSKIDLIGVWQKPGIADRVNFVFALDGDTVDWTSTNASGPFQGTIENLSIDAGPHIITLTASSGDGGSFAQFSSTTPLGPGSCAWNLEGPDSDVDARDLVVAMSEPTFDIASFALEFGRINCP